MPMVIKKSVQEHVFLSKCMAYVIDSTLSKFELFIDGRPTGFEYRDIDFSDKGYVLSQLHHLKSTFFKDIHIRLIDNLIDFFNKMTLEGGDKKLKIYNFNLVWEDMVNSYLNNHFNGVIEGKLDFVNVRTNKAFKKEIIYADARASDANSKKGHRLEPDHYLIEGGRRYIFDAKYYQNIDSLDYKQVAYYFLLKHYQGQPYDNNLYVLPLETYNALILPSESTENKCEPHFKINPNYNQTDKNFQIFTQYLNTINVMKSYVNNET
jgi:hypothetical protein